MSLVRIIVATVASVIALVVLVVLAAFTGLPEVGDLTHHTPRRTALMRARAREALRDGRRFSIDERWVPYERISPTLRRAVLIAEDDAFFSHDGLDWNEIRASAQVNLERGRIVRGGSTITQQLARNLYLGEERTLLRKLREMLLARRLENALTKRRIFELYLNLIEWGDGVFGVEAAARRHFGTSAADLTPRQAALLAAVIINPRRFSAEDPVPRIERRMRMILFRMRHRGFITEDEYLVAIGKAAPHHFFNPFEWLFGGSSHEQHHESSGGTPDTGSASLPPDTSSAVPADSLPG